MEAYNFDQIIDRHNTPASKWNSQYLLSLFGSEDILPFWIADMDFKSPPALLRAIQKKSEFGILAYEYSTPEFYASLIKWITEHHNYALQREWILPSPSIGASVGVVIKALTSPGDGVIIQPPVFMEYRNWIRNNDRRVVKNPLKKTADGYSIDWEDLELKCREPKNRALILCNPHNPIGQIWDSSTLEKIAMLCKINDVLLIADEVHGDIVYPGHSFKGVLSLPDELTEMVIATYSPVKTFNLGSFTDSFMFIPSPKIRASLSDFMKGLSLGKTNGVVRAGLEAAFSESQPWLEALIQYLSGNLDTIEKALQEFHLPVSWKRPQASYQIWLDFSAANMEPKELHAFLCEKARIGLNAGFWFSREGSGYARMNIASPRSVIQEGMHRLKNAFKDMKAV
jgi:cystathionine beta-lyase